MIEPSNNNYQDNTLDEELDPQIITSSKQQEEELAHVIIYPGVIERVKAAFADGVIVVIMMISISELFSKFEHVPDNARIAAAIFIFGLYDPIFTSLFGGTLGHLSMKLQVRNENNQAKMIILPLAILRFMIKLFLGWISLLSIGSSEKRRAMHDIASGSVVIYKNQELEI